MLARRLDKLDRSSSGFPEQLDRLLHDKQWVKSLELLAEGELGEIIGHLNDILDDLDPTGAPFRKCLHVLQKICSTRMVLPATYEVSGELSCSSTEPIAFGGFCDVYQGILGLEKVDIKRLRISSSGNPLSVKKSLCKEAVVWKRLNHPNIVTFRGVTFEPLQLVSEWMPGGELRDYIRNNRHLNLITLLLDIAKGLGYLHSCNVIHADLKGANVVVDAAGHARIVDFGLTTVARDQRSLVSTTEAGWVTPRFLAPEILQGAGGHSKESDVFAFAMVVIEAFTGTLPFGNCIAATAVTNIITGVRPERPTHPDFMDNLWTLTQRCWEEKPQDRPPMDSVIAQLGAYQAPQPISTQPVSRHRRKTSRASSSRTASPLPNFGDTTIFLLFPPFPPPPTNLFGRDSTLEALLGLAERSASVTLHGVGGVGKTAIALTLLRHNQISDRFGRNRYFMRCDDVENTLNGFLQHLFDVIGVRRPADMAQLQSHFEDSPCILVLDGVDSILDPKAPGAAEIASAIEELGRHPKVSLLATSRMDVKIRNFIPMEVPPLPVEAARDAFHSYCHLGRSAAIDDLLAELDFHPLSITLLASTVSENNWDEPMLLEAWSMDKMSILRTSGRLEEIIQSILRAPTIQELGTTAQETLDAIAAFPGDVKEIQLLNTFPWIDGIGDAVNMLCKFSLMYRQDGFVKMLSPFRFYFRESSQTIASRSRSNTSYNSAAEGARHTPEPGTNPLLKFGDGNTAKIYGPTGKLVKNVPQQPERQSEMPLRAKFTRFRKRKFLAFLCISEDAYLSEHTQDRPEYVSH